MNDNKTKLDKLLEKQDEINKQIEKLKVENAKKQKEENQKRLMEIGMLSEKSFNRTGIIKDDYEVLLNKILEIKDVQLLLK